MWMEERLDFLQVFLFARSCSLFRKTASQGSNTAHDNWVPNVLTCCHPVCSCHIHCEPMVNLPLTDASVWLLHYVTSQAFTYFSFILHVGHFICFFEIVCTGRLSWNVFEENEVVSQKWAWNMTRLRANVSKLHKNIFQTTQCLLYCGLGIKFISSVDFNFPKQGPY